MGFISDILIATDHISGSLIGTASYSQTASVSENAVNAQSASYLLLEDIALSTGYMSDAAAAAAGVPIGGIYRSGNFLQIRIS